MKRQFMVLVISAILLLNSLFSTSFAGGCEHQWTLEYDPMYNYEYKDETYHILSSIKLYYICELCSETKIEYQDGSNEKSKHVFTNDVCYSCGYEREEEEHEHRWKLRYDPEYNYEYLNDEYHVLTDIELYYKCKDCGETKKEYQDGVMEYDLMNLVTQGWCKEVKVKCHSCGEYFKVKAHITYYGSKLAR